jgi:7-cyano-7-deazaguanine synthase
MLCLGGGTDSTALIDYYLQEGFNVRGIHFDYGQPSCEGERQAVAAVSRYYNIAVILSDLHPKPMPKPNGEYPCRNALVVLETKPKTRLL